MFYKDTTSKDLSIYMGGGGIVISRNKTMMFPKCLTFDSSSSSSRVREYTYVFDKYPTRSITLKNGTPIEGESYPLDNGIILAGFWGCEYASTTIYYYDRGEKETVIGFTYEDTILKLDRIPSNPIKLVIVAEDG